MKNRKNCESRRENIAYDASFKDCEMHSQMQQQTSIAFTSFQGK